MSSSKTDKDVPDGLSIVDDNVVSEDVIARKVGKDGELGVVTL